MARFFTRTRVPIPARSAHCDHRLMAQAVAAQQHERARRALYANCERAPLGWELSTFSNSQQQEISHG